MDRKKIGLPIVATIVMTLALMVVIYTFVAGKYQITTFMNSYSVDKLEGWQIKMQSEEAVSFSAFPIKVPMKKYVPYTLMVKLPDEIPEDYALMMFTNYSGIHVMADGQEIGYYTKEMPLPVGRLVGNVRLIVRIPSHLAGKTLEIVNIPYYSIKASVNEIFFGKVDALKLKVIYANIWRIAIAAFLFSIIILCMGIFFFHIINHKGKWDFTFFHLGMCQLYIALWLICSSDVPQLYTNANETVSLISFFALVLMIIHFCGYSESLYSIGKKLFHILQYVGWGILFLEVFGFVTTLWDPVEILIFNHVYIAVSIVLSFIYALKQRHEGTAEKMVIIAIVTILVAAGISMIAFYFNQTAGIDAIILGIGIMLFSAVLFGSILIKEVKYLEERNKLETYRELAYKDALTELGNRAAFDEQMLEFNKRMDDNTIISLAILDVNRLKWTNDNIGHFAGDKLIVGAAKCIKRAFGEDGMVYRIGGDEYAVIMVNKKGRMDKDIEKLYEEIKEFNLVERGTIPLSIAVGYEERNWADEEYFSRNVFREADAKMYEDKQRCHERMDVEAKK